MKAKNLEIWKRASKVCSDIYLYFNDNRDYSFKDQITKSSLSVASNIAEGIERMSDKETLRFLDMARSSIAEVQTQIYIGMKINYIENERGTLWVNEYDGIGKMLSSFMGKIKKGLAND